MDGVLDTYTEIHDGPYLRRPAVVGGGGGSPSPAFPVDAVTFEANDDLLRSGALSGVSDGRKFTFSVWYRTDAIPADRRLFVIGTLGQVTIRLNAALDSYDMAFRAILAGVGPNPGAFRSSVSALDDGNWHHIAMSADFDLPQADGFQLMIDGVLDPSVAVIGYSQFADIGYSISGGGNGTGIGRTVPVDGISWVGDFAQFYVNLSERLDFSTLSNREKLIKNGKPVDFGSNGSLVTGSQPELFFDGDKDAFPTNKGTAGTFSLTGNGLTNALTSPSD